MTTPILGWPSIHPSISAFSLGVNGPCILIISKGGQPGMSEGNGNAKPAVARIKVNISGNITMGKKKNVRVFFVCAEGEVVR